MKRLQTRNKNPSKARPSKTSSASKTPNTQLGFFSFEGGNFWNRLLEEGLHEDGFLWDWTTLGTLARAKNKLVRAEVIAKSDGVWAADGLLQALQQCSPTLKIKNNVSDGKSFKRKTTLLSMTGSLREVLALERPFLNLAAYACGIATMTHRLVKIIETACHKNPPRLASTRKTLPLYRDLAIHSIRVGGGYPHRMGLSGGVLIKENHIEAAGGIYEAVVGVRQVAPHGLRVEIEVKTLQELKEAVQARAEGVLLDNFSPAQILSAVSFLKTLSNRPFVEVSGGLSEENLSLYALEGVDILSVGSITHSVKAVDLSLLIR